MIQSNLIIMSPKIKMWLGIMVIIALILLVPLIAMQFTDEVAWTIEDFVVAGAFLFTASVILNLVIIKIKSKNKRLWLSFIIVFVFIVIWVELAVGIFETTIAGS